MDKKTIRFTVDTIVEFAVATHASKSEIIDALLEMKKMTTCDKKMLKRLYKRWKTISE